MSQNAQSPLAGPRDVEELEEWLSRPSDTVVEALRAVDGDLVFLGVGGKMGPTMARMARRAFDRAGVGHRVVGVSRFRNPGVRQRLEEAGIETHVADLLDERDVRGLPDAAAVVSMSGFKFGTSDAPELAWATNCYVPALVCRRYRDTPMVAFSTGNVYGVVAPEGGGSIETDAPRPEGEYAMSALGRERIYEYFGKLQQTPVVILRLNYATELRYGVLVDLAQHIHLGQPVDVTTGYVNVIWLGDANAMSLVALQHAASPACVLNLAGPEIMATRDLCLRLAQRMNRPVQFVGCESERALLNNGSRGYARLGRPSVAIEQLLDWTADWVMRGGVTLGKPTQFQVRTGQF
ncbi:MAG: NAD-dependent epimerase/dehydratase family protein [Pirellulaceae bacterium]